MAVVVHSHDVAPLTEPTRPDAATADAELRLALRVSTDQLNDVDAGRLDVAAWTIVERYSGRLVASRGTVQVVEVTGSAGLVDPAGWWQPPPSAVASVESWTEAGGWAVETVAAVDPLGRYRLGPGWWRITATAGEDPPPDMIEAQRRVAGYLYDSDPSAPHRVAAMRSNVVRLSGAASLLAPYCTRGARGVEVA